MNNPVLEIKDLRTYFGTREGTVRAVDGVSFEVNTGEILGIVGESGCGKSVIALSILKLIPSPGRIISGRILSDGVDLVGLEEAAMRHIRGRQISMIFQEPMTSLNPVISCGNQIREVLMLHQNLDRRRAWRMTIDMLKMVGIPSPADMARQYPHQMSGGMRQRVMIAMALACRPSLLIADEPTTALDVSVQAEILDLLKDLQRELHMSTLFITHDLGVVAEIADRVLVLYAGRTVEQAPTAELFRNPVHPYTKCLLKSIPGIDDSTVQLFTIEGAVPNPFEFPTGCPFHPRCPEVMSECREKEPELREYDNGHKIRCWLPGTGKKS